MKIKSIKAPFGYIAVTHFEEKTSLPAGLKSEIFYNPPCAEAASSGTLRATIRRSAGITGQT